MLSNGRTVECDSHFESIKSNSNQFILIFSRWRSLDGSIGIPGKPGLETPIIKPPSFSIVTDVLIFSCLPESPKRTLLVLLFTFYVNLVTKKWQIKLLENLQSSVIHRSLLPGINITSRCGGLKFWPTGGAKTLRPVPVLRNGEIWENIEARSVDLWDDVKLDELAFENFLSADP